MKKIVQSVYYKYLGERFERAVLSEPNYLNKIINRHRYIKICDTVWSYTVFNCSYMANMANLAVFSLSRGYTPLFDFHSGGVMIGKLFLINHLTLKNL